MIPPTPWVRSFCPLSLLYPSVSDFQFRYTPVTVGKGRAAWFSLRSASVLSFGRGDKAAESGDVDYEYHHIIKGLYATFSSWHIDPCRFPMKCGKSHSIKYLYHILFLFSSKRQHITYLLEISNPNSFPKRYYQTLS